MKWNLWLLSSILIMLISSCKKSPSDNDIKNKILTEYVCPEMARVNSLHILKTSPTDPIFGLKGYQYIVSGEVEWPKGCTEFGTTLPAGFKEKFENKTVVLIKGENGWQ